MSYKFAKFGERFDSATKTRDFWGKRPRCLNRRWFQFGVLGLLAAACGSAPAPASVPQPIPIDTAIVSPAPIFVPTATPAIVTKTGITPIHPPIATSVVITDRTDMATHTALPSTPRASITPGMSIARITSPASGAVLNNEWIDVYGDIACARSEIEYWKFEFEGGGFIAKYTPGMFAGNLLMHWKTTSITSLIGNNQTRSIRVVVICKDGSFVTSPFVKYTFRQ